MADGWTSWWSYVGSALNDDIESAILVNRNRSGELVISLREQIAPEFVTQLDRRLAGTRSRAVAIRASTPCSGRATIRA